MSLLEIFCEIDDFCKDFQKMWESYCLESGQPTKQGSCQMSLSEIMTIEVWFHLSNFRYFKHFYKNWVSQYLRKEFPDLVSYNRFVELKGGALVPLLIFLNTRKFGKASGISFIDSTPLRVCHNLRIKQHRMFEGIAGRGKTSTGWFYGFKLHLTINDSGEMLSAVLTPGNTDDRDRKVIEELTRRIFGKLFGDKGYISQPLCEELLLRNIQLITRIKKNMKNKFMDMTDKILLRKRALIESVIDFLKNICQIEHSRHRSIANFVVNVFAALVAYTFLPKKPSLNLSDQEFELIKMITDKTGQESKMIDVAA